MENKIELSIAKYMNDGGVQESIVNSLGARANQFTTSVISLVSKNEALAKCDRKSLLAACLVSASLDLPINQNLGFAYIIPYKNKSGAYEAQFQMGYKGFVQLAMRSNQCSTLNVSDVMEGEIINIDRLTGDIDFKWLDDGIRLKSEAIGYVAYISLKNGFNKSLYMTREELTTHATKYSQSFKRNSPGMNIWKSDFDSMASKTVLKLLLSKFAPLSIDMQKALEADQAVVLGEGDFKYVDNKKELAEDIARQKESKRILLHISESKDVVTLEMCEGFLVDEEMKVAYKVKLAELQTQDKK